MHTAFPQTHFNLIHGERISSILHPLRRRLFAMEREDINPKLTKKERAQLIEIVSRIETPYIHDGVNFSRLYLASLQSHIQAGGTVEFETLGPYLQSYLPYGGIITRDNLIAEDAIGLELAKVMRSFLPKGRLVSLYDDYNAHTPGNDTSDKSGVGEFSHQLKETFRSSLVALYKSAGVLSERDVENVDYFMLSESSKVTEAEKLVERLESKGYIRRKNEEIVFINALAENPLFHRITLRSAKGKWLCEALDAATFLSAENLEIMHIIVLPDYMKDQQDKVWEILRVLGILPYYYHNIFYSLDYTPSEIAKTVTSEFNRFL